MEIKTIAIIVKKRTEFLEKLAPYAKELHAFLTDGAEELVISPDKKYGGRQPFRTYYGMKYQGGYSDHLPVWADFYVLY